MNHMEIISYFLVDERIATLTIQNNEKFHAVTTMIRGRGENRDEHI